MHVVGSAPFLGAWDLKKSVPLATDSSAYPVWTSYDLFVHDSARTEYKYVIKRDQQLVAWEEGFKGNREIDFALFRGMTIVVRDSGFGKSARLSVSEPTESP